MDPSNNEFRTSTDDPHVSDAGKVTDYDPATKRKVFRASQRAGLIGQRLAEKKAAATADAARLARVATARQHLNSGKSDDYDYEKLRGGVRDAAGRYDPSHELEREILRDPEKFHDALAVYRMSRKDMPKIPLGLGALGALSLWSKAKDVERAVGRLRVLYPNLYDTEESLSGARTRARAFAKKLRIAAAGTAALGLYGAHRSHKYNKALTRDMNDPARREALRGEMERRYGKEKTAMAPLLAAALPAVAGKLAPSVLSGLSHIAKPGLLPLIGAGAGALYGGYRNGWQGALNGFMTGGMVGKGLESRVFPGGAPPAQGQAQSQAPQPDTPEP